MATTHATIPITTQAKHALVNLTEEVGRALRKAGARDGLALVSVPHTTCGVCVNEDEAGLRQDLLDVGARLVDHLEPGDGFRHDCVDDNARAHLAALLVGASVTVPVRDGALALGTWQSILVLELDGPRARTVHLTFVGD